MGYEALFSGPKSTWCKGQITEHVVTNGRRLTNQYLLSLGTKEDVRCNFKVHYSADDETVDHILIPDMYYSDSCPPFEHMWFLLEEKPLDAGVSSADIRPPCVQARAGKPQSARLKPPTGPTASGAKKRKKGSQSGP